MDSTGVSKVQTPISSEVAEIEPSSPNLKAEKSEVEFNFDDMMARLNAVKGDVHEQQSAEQIVLKGNSKVIRSEADDLMPQSPKGKELHAQLSMDEIKQQEVKPILRSAAQKLDILSEKYVSEKSTHGKSVKLDQIATQIKDLLGLSNKDSVEAMIKERNTVKQFKADFLPGKVPKMSGLPSKSGAKSVVQFNWRNLGGLALAHSKHDIKVVDETSRQIDLGKGFTGLKTKMLAPEVRDQNRTITTSAGLMRHDFDSGVSKPFSSQGFVSHDKKDYAAFVITPEGQLYNFNHLDKTDAIAHSSYTKGGPAFGGGEMKVNEQGQLEVLTSYSGHYKPGPKDMARVLHFLEAQGMDVRNAIVTFKDVHLHPGLSDLKSLDRDTIKAPVANEAEDVFVNVNPENRDRVYIHLGSLYSANDIMEKYSTDVFAPKAPEAKFADQEIDESFSFNEARAPEVIDDEVKSELVDIDDDELESDDDETVSPKVVQDLTMSERLRNLQGFNAPQNIDEDEVVQPKVEQELTLSERLRNLQGFNAPQNIDEDQDVIDDSHAEVAEVTQDSLSEMLRKLQRI